MLNSDSVCRPCFVYGFVNNFLAKADPWLIATAFTLDKAVVTLETPGGHGAKKVKIPDVCDAHQVKWLTTFDMLSALQPKFGLII